MESIQELEQKLKLAKEEVAKKDLEKEFENFSKLYNNKAWASHKLSRSGYPGKGVHFWMIKLYDFRKDKDKGYIFTKKEISYVNTINHKMYTVNTYDNMGMNIFYGMGRLGMELKDKNLIPVDKFDLAEKMVDAGFDNIIDDIRKYFKQEEIITMGDHSSERKKLELLRNGNVDCIDLNEYQNKHGQYYGILEVLNWTNHPLLIANMLVNSKQSKEICLNIAKDLQKKAIQWGGSILDRDMPRVEMIRSFVNNTKWIE